MLRSGAPLLAAALFLVSCTGGDDAGTDSSPAAPASSAPGGAVPDGEAPAPDATAAPSVEIPAEWPTDVPVPELLVLTAAEARTTEAGVTVVLTGRSDRAPAEVVAATRAALTGWSTTLSVESGDLEAGEDLLANAVWSQGERALNLAATLASGAPHTEVSVTYSAPTAP